MTENPKTGQHRTATRDGRAQRPSIGLDSIPGLDPAAFAANLEPFFEAGSRFLDTWRVVSDELCEFGKSRLTRNIAAGRKVSQCGSIDQALEAQADFARSMMQDYIAETGKLAELGTRAIFESLSAWKVEAQKTPAVRAVAHAKGEAEEEAPKHSMAAE